MARVALVTGGTRGLGRAICEELKAQGCRVAAVYHGNDAAARMLETETGIHAFKCDVSGFDACRDGLIEVARVLGPVDILVNNAGITRDATLHHMSPEQWSAVINTNLGSMFNMCRQVIDDMRQSKFGRIINVSSINGQKGQYGQTNYAAAKAGVLGFTKALALEEASRGITVNAIAPGYCGTEMVAAVSPDVMKSIVADIPVGRIGTPGDIARAAAFLASDHAGFITGATLSVNGGQYMA